MKTFDRSTSNRNISKPWTVTSAHIIFIPFSKLALYLQIPSIIVNPSL